MLSKGKDKEQRALSKKEFSQKLDHVIKKHNFVLITFSKPTWCMYCSKFIYGLVHQGFECKVCKYQCHKKCLMTVPDTCGDPLPRVKGEKLQHHTSQNENFSSLARLVAGAVLQGVSAEQQHQDMFITSIKNGDKKMAAYMIDRYISTDSADINMKDVLGNTALHYMAMGDFESDLILHALKSTKLLCNIENEDGNTPLHYLCQKFPTVDCVEVGENFIARGADVNKQNKNGETPLHKAVFNGRVRFLLAEMLIRHHANLNLVSAQGETPLHYAVRLNREDLVSYLLIEGALSDIAGTKEKKTPLQLAQEARLVNIEILLSKADEVTNFLKELDLVIYRKPFVESELTMGNVTGRIDNRVLDQMGIKDPVHRTTLLQHKTTRKPRVSTPSGRHIQQTIMEKTQDQHLHLRGDNWIIQNDEVEFIKKLGQGASGTVFKGLFLGVEVAIKVLKKELATDIDDFIKEFTTMYQIRSTSVITVYGAILEPKVCLVMELAHMGSLYNVLCNPSFNPTWESTFDFSIEAAEGMAFLHAHDPPLLHRDLKTLNLMVTNQMTIKVGDFGLSIFDNSQSHTKEGVTGTAAYLAPEILDGSPFTLKADVYAFAVVFWELVNTTLHREYQPPFREYNLNLDFQILFNVSTKDLRPSLPAICPPEVIAFLTTCWNKDPEVRPDFPGIIVAMRELRKTYLENSEKWDAVVKQVVDADTKKNAPPEDDGETFSVLGNHNDEPELEHENHPPNGALSSGEASDAPSMADSSSSITSGVLMSNGSIASEANANGNNVHSNGIAHKADFASEGGSEVLHGEKDVQRTRSQLRLGHARGALDVAAQS